MVKSMETERQWRKKEKKEKNNNIGESKGEKVENGDRIGKKVCQRVKHELLNAQK